MSWSHYADQLLLFQSFIELTYDWKWNDGLLSGWRTFSNNVIRINIQKGCFPPTRSWNNFTACVLSQFKHCSLSWAVRNLGQSNVCLMETVPFFPYDKLPALCTCLTHLLLISYILTHSVPIKGVNFVIVHGKNCIEAHFKVFIFLYNGISADPLLCMKHV